VTRDRGAVASGCNLRLFAIGMLLILVTTTCSQGVERFNQDGRILAIPSANYAGVAWLRPDTIFLSRIPDPESIHTELWSVRPNGSGFVQVPIDDPECARADIHALTRLPDRRIGFIEFCLNNPNFAIPSNDNILLSAVDPASGRVERLMKEPIGFNGHQFTWNPQLTEGFASTLSDLCGSVVGLYRDGPVYLSIPWRTLDSRGILPISLKTTVSTVVTTDVRTGRLGLRTGHRSPFSLPLPRRTCLPSTD